MKIQRKGREKMNVFWSYGKAGAIVSTGVSAAGTALVSFVGGWDKPLQALIMFIVLDFALGTLAAIKNGEMDSKVLFWGGINKILVLGLVAVGVVLDGILPLSQPYCRTAIIFFYIGREGLSLIENYGKMGYELPEFLVNMLAQMKDKSSNPQENKRVNKQEVKDNKEDNRND